MFKNLKNSFPEKPDDEIHTIVKNFYINLTDIMVETIKCISIKPEEIQKRVKITNPELLEGFLKNGDSVITLTSHQGNWEWLLLANSLNIKNGKVVAAFQQVSTLADFMKNIRSKFGAKLVEKKKIMREMVKKNPYPTVFALVADQTPVDLTSRFWATFLNQETAFFSGAEKIAIKYDMPVLYVDMQRVKRGFYEVSFTVIGTPPYEKKISDITQKYVVLLENGIKNNPSNWLWSHKRWKYKKPS